MFNKMGKTSRLLVMAFVIIALPNIVLMLFERWDRNDFREEANFNRELCYERAERDNYSKTICDQIVSNVSDAQKSSSKSSRQMVLFLTMIIFGLGCGIIGLKTQIDELKAKIDV
jgi:hypothetical protein